MAFATLLSDTAKTVLTVKSVDSYKEERVNIPNNNYLLSLCPLLEPTAKALGIDLAKAETTFTVTKGKNGWDAYQPFVANRDGKAAIVWGKVNVPLEGITGLTLEQEKEKPVFCVEVGDELVKFPIMFPKGVTLDYASVRKAFKNGTLADSLSKGFEKPSKLAELEPGDYNITAIRENVFKGEVNYEIYIDGRGWFKTNSKIRRKIDAGLKVSPEAPALMTSHGVIDTTSQGHPVVGIDIMSKEELDLPAFVF